MNKVICVINTKNEEAKDATKEDRDKATVTRQPHIFSEEVAFVLGLERWSGVPLIEWVEHVQRPRGTERGGPCKRGGP